MTHDDQSSFRQPCVARRLHRILLGCTAALLMAGAGTSSAAELTLYSAGSLRTAMTALIERFGRETGVAIKPTFGASGMLREKIVAGPVPDIFASANLEHPQALQRQGLLQDTVVFTENRLCVLAAPGVTLQPQDLLAQLRDPQLRLATGSPIVDPGGDYTWAMFRKADAIEPGSFALLEKKALQIMGKPGDDGRPLGVLAVLAQHRADLVVAYCSYGRLVQQKVPGASWSHLPPALDVPSRYGIATAVGASADAARFVAFVRSLAGQTILADHGFGQ